MRLVWYAVFGSVSFFLLMLILAAAGAFGKMPSFDELENPKSALATEVYNTIQVQYKVGLKSYLDVVIAQNDLVTAQITYLESLYRVLTSKVDLEKALGVIQY